MGKLIYSTGPGGTQVPTPGDEKSTPGTPPERQSIRVRRETSGRKGKTVTVAEGFEVSRPDAKRLLGDLKRRSGGGGTLKSAADGRFVLEVQGDHVESVLARLEELGFKAKRSGG